MTEKEFKKIINDTNYHFFIFASPAKIPFHFIRHTRIVIKDKNGTIERWEVAHYKNKAHPKMKFMFKDSLAPWQGLGKYLWKSNRYFSSSILYHISGGEKSPAHEAVSFVQQHIQEYPDKNKYYLICKNSNSFVKRAVTNIPSIKYEFPKNILG